MCTDYQEMYENLLPSYKEIQFEQWNTISLKLEWLIKKALNTEKELQKGKFSSVGFKIIHLLQKIEWMVLQNTKYSNNFCKINIYHYKIHTKEMTWISPSVTCTQVYCSAFHNTQGM